MYDGISPMPECPNKSDLKKYDQSEFADLKAAHAALDAAAEAAYSVNFNGDEEKMAAHLFKLYAEVVNAEDPAAPANIDLTIDGEPWEMKNVTNVSSSAGNQLRRVRRKWRKLNLGKPLRAVLTTEGATDTFDEIVAALEGKKRDDERFIALSSEGELRRLRGERGRVPIRGSGRAPHIRSGTVSRRRSLGVFRSS